MCSAHSGDYDSSELFIDSKINLGPTEKKKNIKK